MRTQPSLGFILTFLALLAAQTAWSSPTVEDFMQEPDVRDAELSPDGKHLAMILEDGSYRKVVVFDAESPDMPIVGAFAEKIIRPSAIYWGNNDRLLIAMSVPLDYGRAMRESRAGTFNVRNHFLISRMVAVDKDMQNQVVLLEDERAVQRSVSLSQVTNFLPDKPDHVLMAAYSNYKRVQYEINIVTGKSRHVATGSTRTFKFLNDEDGRPLYRYDYREKARAIEIFGLEDDENWALIEKLHLSQDDVDSIESIRFAALNIKNVVYRKRNEETGYFELFELDRETNEKRTLVSLDGRDVHRALFDQRTDQIVGYQTEKDYVRNVYFDKKDQELYDEIAEQLGNKNFRVSDLSHDNGKALIRAWAADDPYSYYLWDSRTKDLSFLSHAYRDLAAGDLGFPAMATYRSRDGARIRTYILLPPDFENGNQYPTVIVPHGGPQARSRPVFWDFAHFLATRGYIVVQPNFRGSTGYGRDFEEAGYKQWGGLMQDDLTDAVDFMVRKGYADPQRICIVGASYGGYAALMGAIKTPDLFKCAISLNGVTHLASQVEHTMKHRIDEEEWDKYLFSRIGHPELDKEMLDANSPAMLAEQIKVPVMVVAGTADEIVPFSQARRMINALEDADVDHEFIRLKDSGHNPFRNRQDMVRVFNAIEEFLKTHLH